MAIMRGISKQHDDQSGVCLKLAGIPRRPWGIPPATSAMWANKEWPSPPEYVS